MALAVSGCGAEAEKKPAARAPSGPSFAGKPVEVRGLRVPARVGGGGLELGFGSSFRSRFWPGVNLGSTVPGTSPGEVAATRADYDRWLAGMGDMGVRAVRVYTILRPAFYDALVAYNRRNARAPIHVIHGVWIPEEEFVATRDAYSPAVTEGFRAEIADAVRAVHGDADLPQRPGHAGGRYRSDISPWLLAWSIGVEWDPQATHASDRTNRDRPAYHGRFVTTTGQPTPMESWMASMLDHTAALEAERGWSRPVTFTNWVTTDPLRHGEEPLGREDLVSIDAKHLRATPRWPGGFFASYHVYPYYPDFLRLDPDYAKARRARDGERDPYSGYLRALRAHHGSQPVMVTEFGVPSSNGLAHLGPLGRDQGGHSEQQAGRIDADLLQDIHEEGYAGGMLFEWTDEWFKHTWNTADYEPFERRHLWRNVLTNEEHFGVIASEAGSRPVALPDGEDFEWERNGSEVIASASGAVREIRAVKDEAYLHLRLRLADGKEWQREPLVLGLDVRRGGNRGLPGHPGVHPEADVAVTVGPGRRAKVEQAAWTDPIAFQYGVALDYVPVPDPAALEPESGVWVSPRLILNRPYTVPGTGEKRPVELADMGPLPFGTANPRDRGHDARVLAGAREGVVELRIPWALLGFSDPSSHQVVVPHADGSFTHARVGRVGITALTAGGELTRTRGFAWKGWDAVRHHERRKRGFDTVRRAFDATAVAGVER